MSDNILKLIPSSLTFIPGEDSKEKARASIKLLFPLASQVNFGQSDNPEFVDPGANLERIICPKCFAAINEFWWKKAMDKAYENKFMDLSVFVPCCNSKTSLNDLKYEWPAGFAQFSIEIVNPDRDILEEELHEVETILDTKLRRIWSHY